MALSILVAVPGNSEATMISHFVLFGITFGSITPLRAMVMTKWYAGDHYGQISGTQGFAMFFVAAFGATAVGVARDVTGSYVPALIAMAIGVTVGAVLTIAAGRADDARIRRSAETVL